MTPRPRLEPDIVRLGIVSFLTDVSSEMIFSVFAIVFTTVAGASSALLGLVEGLADFAVAALNIVAGWRSDHSGRRRVYALAGYGLSTLAKTLLLVSTSVAGLAAFRVVERLGKGLRGPPRDAWLAALARPAERGYSFGVHKALDKAGAVVGPLLAYALLSWLGESAATYRTLFWIAFVPAVASVTLLARLPDRPGARHERERLDQGWRALSPGFKRFLLPAGVFALAYYSLGFVLLRAHQLGVGLGGIVLLYAWFNTTCVLAAPWVGRLGDRIGRPRVLQLGYALYGLVNVGLVFATGTAAVVALFALYGGFYAIEESQSRAFIADLEPERRATATGAYNFVTGALYLPASLMAGGLWAIAPSAAFGLSAALSGLAIAAFTLRSPVAEA